MGIPLHRRVVPTTYTQLLYDYVEAQGHRPEDLLGEPWPQPDADGVSGVDVERWAAMLARAEDRLGDPLLGLHLGASITVRHLGILGTVLLACDNLAAALQKFDRYQRLIFDVTPMLRRAGDGYVDLVWDNRAYQPARLVEETGFAVLIQFCRSLVRGSVQPRLVEFALEGPGERAAYEAFFGCEVRFGCPEPRIRLGNELFAMPLKSPDLALVEVLEQHANRLLSQLPQQQEIVEQVRRAIADRLREGEPDIEQVSAKLGLSSRTLQKRLQKAGTGFRDETQLVRRSLAMSYLQDPRLQIVEIALLLGYSEQSAFTRAFREWTGRPPGQMRGERARGASTADVPKR